VNLVLEVKYKYAIKAWLSVPPTSNETLDLSLSQLKNREIENLKVQVQYRTVFRAERKNNIDSKQFLSELMDSLVIYKAFP